MLLEGVLKRLPHYAALSEGILELMVKAKV
jgi:hypothetical protein